MYTHTTQTVQSYGLYTLDVGGRRDQIGRAENDSLVSSVFILPPKGWITDVGADCDFIFQALVGVCMPTYERRICLHTNTLQWAF